MRRIASMFWSQGHDVIAADHRGTGDGQGLAAKPYHMGSTADLSAVFQTGRALFPGALHVAIGFSLSATALLLLLGRDRDQGLCQPDRAVAVSPVVNMEAASRRLSQGLNRLYELRFVNVLCHQIEERWRRGLIPSRIRVSRAMTLRDLDAAYTAPQAGFRDRDDYYQSCSCGRHLHDIRVPTVILDSTDDPFATARDMEGLDVSPAVHLHVEPLGGHMGFVSKAVPGYRWLDYALDHYVRELSSTSWDAHGEAGSDRRRALQT
jgi:hypothetical protein